MSPLEPSSMTGLARHAAGLIAEHGDGLLNLGEGFANTLAEKGADSLAGTAVAALFAWIKARAGAKSDELDQTAATAVKAKDEASVASLARSIELAVGGAAGEFEVLVRVAQEAAAITVTTISFGEVKAGIVVAGGGHVEVGRQDISFP